MCWQESLISGNLPFRNKDGSLTQWESCIVNKIGCRSNIGRYVNGLGFGQKDKIAYPATFPEKLAEDHIISWSNDGDIVLNPMCGSGTTLKMAKKNNRNFVGIEISPEYCRIAEQRLKNIQPRLDLWFNEDEIKTIGGDKIQ